MASDWRIERVATDDGEFDALTGTPVGGSGPGLVVLQEIFGVGSYIRAAAERLADLGYVAMAPDVFWRIERNVALEHDEAGLNKGFELRQRFDQALGVRDGEAALQHLRAQPEVAGGAGVLGFCFGGTLAYLLAVHSNPDAAVSYYGSGVPDAIELAERITCPILFHFGGQDPYIPRERIRLVEEMAAARDHFEVHVQEGAGHAFDNHDAPMFHDPVAATAAWLITTEFLQRHLPR
jgi:carboxymethylenebutenolidase